MREGRQRERGRDRVSVKGRPRGRQWEREKQGRHPYSDSVRRWNSRHGGHNQQWSLAERGEVGYKEDSKSVINEENGLK